MLFPRDYDDIFSSIYQDLTENTPITNMGESSTARVIAESVANRLAALWSTIDAYHSTAYLSTATGEFLDHIGELHGVTRHQATRAYSGDSNFQFYIDPATGYTVTDLINNANAGGASISEVRIMQGTTITVGDEGISYTTTSDAVLTNDGVYVTIVATGTGDDYNVGPGALVRHNISSNQLDLYPIANYILCSNDEAVETGVDYETDTNYRARIRNARIANVGGNEVAIRNAALSVPGVSDVVLNRYPEGIGTYNVVVITEYPVASTAVLNAVHESIGQVTSYGLRPLVSTPEYLAIELKVKLHFQPTATIEMQDIIKRDVRRAIIDYTNNISIGGEWIVNEAIQRTMDISNDIKDVEQEWFRVHKYYSERMVLTSGRGRVKAETNQLQLSEGSRMIWTNQRCKSANPPQKFLMLGRHLVVC